MHTADELKSHTARIAWAVSMDEWTDKELITYLQDSMNEGWVYNIRDICVEIQRRFPIAS